MARHHGLPFPFGLKWWLLTLAAEAVYVGFLFLPDARSRLTGYLALVGLAGLLCLLAAPILSTTRPRIVMLCALLFRATLLFRAPDVSDDVFRYLWDARVQRAGISPWRYAPEDPALSRLDPVLRSRVAHPDVRTIYPPVAQAAFWAASRGGRSAFGLKAAFAAADLAVVWLLCRESLFAGALYAFHPLAVSEIAGQGHVDAIGIAFLLAALAALRSRRRIRAGLLYVGSVFTKYVPLAAALPMARRGRLAFVLASAAASAVIWVGATRGGVSPAGGMNDYATRWEFNSAVYPAALRIVESADLPARAKARFLEWKAAHGHPPWTQAVFPYFYSAFFTRMLLAILLALVLAGIAWRVRDTQAATFASIAALMLASPTFHPWYALWTLPFAARSREPAFLFLSLASPLGYGLLYPVTGLPAGLLLGAEYVPFALLLAMTLRRAVRRTADRS